MPTRIGNRRYTTTARFGGLLELARHFFRVSLGTACLLASFFPTRAVSDRNELRANVLARAASEPSKRRVNGRHREGPLWGRLPPFTRLSPQPTNRPDESRPSGRAGRSHERRERASAVSTDPGHFHWCLRPSHRLFCRRFEQRAAEADGFTTHRARSRARWRRTFTLVKNARWVHRFFDLPRLLPRDRLHGIPSPSLSDTSVIGARPSKDGSSLASSRRPRRSPPRRFERQVPSSVHLARGRSHARSLL